MIWAALRHVPESLDPSRRGRRLDIAGALLAALALAGGTFALTDGPAMGWGEPRVVGAIVVCLVALVAFVVVERRASDPLVPGRLLRIRQFVAANIVTLALYAALSGALFLLPLELQISLGYSPLEAGDRAAAADARDAAPVGARRPARAADRAAAADDRSGRSSSACGMLLMTRIGPGASYVTEVLPAVLVLALGLATTVAPLTTTVLAAADDSDAGVASAINNTVARVAGLLAVAVIPVAAGLGATTTWIRRRSTRRSTAASSSPASSRPPAASSPS